MQKRIVDGVEVRRSSANIFVDLGLPDADKLKVKTDLAIEIRKTMKVLGLTRTEAARRMDMSQAKVSRMMRGDFTNLTERKLMACLNRLNHDIEVKPDQTCKCLDNIAI